VINIYEVMEALEDAIKHCDPAKRKALATLKTSRGFLLGTASRKVMPSVTNYSA
jgi:hypothetical protein